MKVRETCTVIFKSGAKQYVDVKSANIFIDDLKATLNKNVAARAVYMINDSFFINISEVACVIKHDVKKGGRK